MSFIQIIRDFFEVITTSYGSGVAQLPPNDINFQKIIEIAFLFCLQNIKFIIFNFFSFEWAASAPAGGGEGSQFQIFIPKISESILRETFFLENYNPIHIIFDTYNLNTNKFFIGFLNGFFLSLPFSCSHLIVLRRLLVQGRVAGISASLGNICGQILFVASIIFGIRVFIIPFFSFQPLVYISGTFLLLTAIYNMVHEKSIKIIKETDTKQIVQIFFLNFFLIWTEQSCIYQFFTNISIGPEPTLLESFIGFPEKAASLAEGNFASEAAFSSFLFIHFIYLIGLFFGSIFFNCILGLLLENGSQYFQIRLKILKSSWIVGSNFVLLSSIITLTFTSIPYYTIDYLVTSQLGFISQDKAFKNTIFSENNVIDSIGFLGSSDFLSLDTDIANFDRGFYLKKPGFESFEELNYSGEYATYIQQGSISDEQKEKAKGFTSFLRKTKSNLDFLGKDKAAATSSNEAGGYFGTQKGRSTGDNEGRATSSGKGRVTPGSTGSSAKKEENLENESMQPQNLSKFFEYPTSFQLDTNFSPSSVLESRFRENYKILKNGSFTVVLENSLNRLFCDEDEIVLNPEVEKKIKQKYYSNPVYKFLLNIDIDLFLKRQFHKISGEEEKELHQKRLLVTRYNDTLRFYNLLPYSEEFQFFFNGTKSFADRVYNQQFKGTLKIVRRLFSISFFSASTAEVDEGRVNPATSPAAVEAAEGTKTPEKGILKYDQPFFLNQSQTPAGSKQRGGGHDFYHEELSLEEKQIKKKPFIEIMNQDPFYIGWDANLRKIIVTNRMVAKKTAIFENDGLPSLRVDKTNNTAKGEDKKEKMVFTAWPILEKNIKSTNKVLFTTKENMQNREVDYSIYFQTYDSAGSSYITLPSNLENFGLKEIDFDIFPPNRGGFVWPGGETPTFLKGVSTP